jgi:hypothetical protein
MVSISRHRALCGMLKSASLAAVTGLALTATVAQAAEPVESKVSFSGGLDFSSHFISFGADVWGGGNDPSPFSSRSTVFAYGTLSAKITDEIGGFVNVWTDLNDNTDSAIGGPIQEIDLNAGLTYTWDKFTFGAAHNYWLYAGDNENAIEITAAYNDAGSYGDLDLALNPSLLFHWRYNGQGEQSNSLVVQLGIRPTVYTALKDSDYPITFAVPTNIALFTDDYQGGTSGLGYFNVGVVAGVPLAFVPAEYGSWSASAGITYWYTPDSTIPGNPQESFLVTSFSVGVSF